MDRLQSSYYEGYRADDLAIDKLRTATFEARLSNMKSINNLLNRDALGTRATLDYVLTAFDIDPSTESNFKLRQVLMSDPSDPNSFVSKLKDERYEKLAAAFNFGADGKPTTQRLVQSVSSQTATGTLYATSFGTDVNAAKKDIIKADTQAYLKAVGEMRSLDDFIADKTSIKYALKAYGLADEKISDADLRKLFTSDLADPKSFANAKADKRYVKLVSAFNFTPDGRVRRDAEGAQSGFTLLTTQNKFLLQTMETQVGQQSEGARLALYFLRKAPDVTSAYGILADKALFEVARTALGLPAGISGMEIESQAKLWSPRSTSRTSRTQEARQVHHPLLVALRQREFERGIVADLVAVRKQRGFERDPRLPLRRGTLLAPRADVDRIERAGRRDEEAVAPRTPEAQVGHHLRHEDLAEPRAVRREAMDAVRRARPEIAGRIDTDAVGDADVDHAEHAVVPQCFALDTEATDMGRRAVGVAGAGIRDVEDAFVRREGKPVRLEEVVDDAADLAALPVHPVDAAHRLFGLGLRALVVAHDAVGRIGEPDGAVRADHEIVRRVQTLALEHRRSR